VPAATLGRQLGSQFLGTALLLATVVGSGVMADKLAGGNVAIALPGNTIPTGAMLVVLILVFGPVSGAHLNPAVTLSFVVRGDIRPALAGMYVATQIAAAYWFTASTSFANPAVTIGRSLTNTFSGIQPPDMPAFLVAQCIGALLATAAAAVLIDGHAVDPSG
jgi:glycerol uptake facilitator-like aquaporin